MNKDNDIWDYLFCNAIPVAVKKKEHFPDKHVDSLVKWLIKGGVKAEDVRILDKLYCKHGSVVSVHGQRTLVIFDHTYFESGLMRIQSLYDIGKKIKGWIHADVDKVAIFVADDVFYVVSLKELRESFAENSELWHAQIVPKNGGKLHQLYYATRIINVPIEKTWVELWKK